MSQPGDASERLEFEILAKRAGVDIPEDRVEAIYAGYKDLKRMTALLRTPRTAASEPSNTYSLTLLMKGV